MQTINTRQSNIEMADKAILATMPEQRKAAIAALIATGEIASAQHATFMSATRLIKLPHLNVTDSRVWPPPRRGHLRDRASAFRRHAGHSRYRSRRLMLPHISRITMRFSEIAPR